jgi:Ni/Co efflux regulator RcnB
MKATKLLLLNLAAAGFLCLPVVSAYAYTPQDHRDDHAQAQHGNEHAQQYHFRQQDTQKLRQHYNQTNYRHQVDASHRAHLVRGGHLPSDWHAHIHPLPPQYVRELPPPPAGYLMGYYDGYAVVYNPNTGLILEVVNVY